MTQILRHFLPRRAFGEAIISGKLPIPFLKRESNEKHPCIWFCINDEYKPDTQILKNQGHLHIWERSVTMPVYPAQIVWVGIDFGPFLLSWEEYWLLSKVNRKRLPGIAIKLFSNCNPNDWFALLHEIDASYWVRIEKLEGESWIEFQPEAISK